MVSKEEFGVSDGIQLVLKDKDGKVKATRGMLKLPELEKTDKLIQIVDFILKEEEVKSLKDELQDFVVCPNCGYDKFRYLKSGKLHCLKCDKLFAPELKHEVKKRKY